MVKRVTTAVKKAPKATETRPTARTSTATATSKPAKSKAAPAAATPQLKKSSAPKKADAVKAKPVAKPVAKGQNGSVGTNGRNGAAVASTLVGSAKLPGAKLAGKGKADKSKPALKTEMRRPTLFNTRPAGVLAAARAAASRSVKAVEASQRRSPGLTSEELAEFRQILLDKRREIVDDIANLDGEARRINTEVGSTSSTMPIHMADLGSDTWEQEFTLNLIEKQRGIIREIDEALDRVSAGQYGICLATGRPITKARLRAKPWAKYCIEYAQKRERGLA